ncbi:transcriptional regulator, NifA subfamily, Fis Family [Thioalkalivibrio sulfidiphilus HL-EbGr7]|uniref:Transcriptional regulator, NifA subfamily, Fis Family n=1 Tax=Thioalkalivibrio sulfidiphilus (strain HL-EbGR7) TaxID=396588 RepID=B8GM58_THISH|nr:sigma 54-interacting transcriptional regulator [Thioalkalivibrio sulfidiphilus]ACL73645.1 transcriptional regulator, NifA subfamily, Fis Family [Thioalkalivibrio sulfidiphilus HL-EbGr7]
MSAPVDHTVLQAIANGVAAETGEAFFDALVQHLAGALNVQSAWVTEWHPEASRLRALSFWSRGRFVPDYEYPIHGTPCEAVISGQRLVVVPERVVELYPDDPDLPGQDAVSYMGMPLRDTDGTVLGNLAVLDSRPLEADATCQAVFGIFGARAAAELARLRRDRRLRALNDEAAALRAELGSLRGFEEILGESAALRRLLADIGRVAPSEATVLITGETGTGKELIARAIHRHSRRSQGPLIKVNCAAITATLQESEFFGHEKGAFTGAAQRRDGRFKLADGGTLFLDEVGEMPLDLQAKLLRVLQEGEFEPVGSGRTVRVDVRVIAATHRDLTQMVREGGFREDLLYRLNVFPLHAPPLRERGEDVVLLAEAIATRLARQEGATLAPLSPADRARLKAHPWPGNVRELENVIERAWITGTDTPDGRVLNLVRALPGSEVTPRTPGLAADPDAVFTAAEMLQMERSNIERALVSCQWKLSGVGGAARLLGLHPNTLASRMKSLGIRRPD